MPSDARTSRALDALAAYRDRYRSAVSAAHDQMAGYLAAHRARSYGRAQTVATELGRFAAGRIDAERFSALFADAHVLTTETSERVERLVGVLAELLAEGDALFTCDVPRAADMHEFVDRAIAQAGRVFGAVLAFQAVKTGTYRPERHDAGVLAFPFERWNHSERLLALPLVVEVDGADLNAEALVEYLDGGVAIILVVRGACSPAPLVRVITPGVLVVQTTDVAELRVIADRDVPAIAALVPPESARFVHDPRGGGSLRSRLQITSLPSERPKHPLGSRSAWQQREELAQLLELAQLRELEPAAAPVSAVDSAPSVLAGPSVSGVAPHDAGAVDRLASWLLAGAGLSTSVQAGGGDR